MADINLVGCKNYDGLESPKRHTNSSLHPCGNHFDGFFGGSIQAGVIAELPCNGNWVL